LRFFVTEKPALLEYGAAPTDNGIPTLRGKITHLFSNFETSPTRNCFNIYAKILQHMCCYNETVLNGVPFGKIIEKVVKGRGFEEVSYLQLVSVRSKLLAF
jgi:hypothetical protein